MRNRLARLVRIAAGLVLCLVLLTPPALAQDENEFHDPAINYKNPNDFKAKMYIDGLCTTVMVVAVILIATKNPHRSHLD